MDLVRFLRHGNEKDFLTLWIEIRKGDMIHFSY